MFEQYIGDGANLFIAIVATIIGFGAAMGLMDFNRTKEEGPKD